MGSPPLNLRPRVGWTRVTWGCCCVRGTLGREAAAPVHALRMCTHVSPFFGCFRARGGVQLKHAVVQVCQQPMQKQAGVLRMPSARPGCCLTTCDTMRWVWQHCVRVTVPCALCARCIPSLHAACRMQAAAPESPPSLVGVAVASLPCPVSRLFVCIITAVASAPLHCQCHRGGGWPLVWLGRSGRVRHWLPKQLPQSRFVRCVPPCPTTMHGCVGAIRLQQLLLLSVSSVVVRLSYS